MMMNISDNGGKYGICSRQKENHEESPERKENISHSKASNTFINTNESLGDGDRWIQA
jgi:hypothetical protein